MATFAHTSSVTDAVQPGSTSESKASCFECDLCGVSCEGRPTSSGLFIWHRGEEVRYEEPPLCQSCSSALTLGAVFRWAAVAGDE